MTASADIDNVKYAFSKTSATKHESQTFEFSSSAYRLSCGIIAIWAVLALAPQGFAATRPDYRFGQDTKQTSVSLFAGSSFVSGERSGIGANGFSTLTSAVSLYRAPRHLGLEYGEHGRRTTLAFALEYTQIVVSNNLRTELGLAENATLSVSYLDAPITYRVHAFPAGRAPLNISAGLSLIVMLDIASSSVSVFESGSNATSGGASGASGTSASSGALANKHVDLGFGFGGEIGVERRLSGNIFLTGQAGFHRPLSGVTRPNFGFFLLGLRVYQR